jgi:hypothetical protein
MSEEELIDYEEIEEEAVQVKANESKDVKK